MIRAGDCDMVPSDRTNTSAASSGTGAAAALRVSAAPETLAETREDVVGVWEAGKGTVEAGRKTLY